eukprot:4803344-Karenia_brevis.AAC.1
MLDYCQDALKLYRDCTGRKDFRRANTPFCPDGSLPAADEEVQGMLSGDSCRLLMKALWAARLARPDIAKAINDLSCTIMKWTQNDDK